MYDNPPYIRFCRKKPNATQATIDGIETAHMIRKGQLSEENIPAYKQFIALAG
nr:hypothetical protein [Bathymodiolus platifrons methanotrophic gill symbiont]